MEIKKCAYCNKTMPVDNFPRQGNWYNAYCKSCRLEYKRKNYVRAVFTIAPLDGEIWRQINSYKGCYSISNKGRVKSNERKSTGVVEKVISEKLLTLKNNIHGYPTITLCSVNRKSELVHRLVAEAFIPNPENKRTVNHKDGDKENNCVENLEWATYGENQIHAYRTGLRKSRMGKKLGKRIAA